MLKNDAIILKPISVHDTDFILELRNNLKIADNFFSDPPLYDFQHDNWLKTKNKDDLDFIISENQTKVRVGRISITNVNYKHQKGEYGIVLLPEYTGKNIAFEASALLINYVFINLPINKIYLEVFESNLKAIKLYEKLGFKKEGLLIEEYFKNGTFKNILKMGILKKEWKNSTKYKTFR